MSRQYTTIAQIEDYSLLIIAPTFQSRVISWVEEISKYIEQTTGRRFIAEPLIKKYDGKGDSSLFIDEVVEINQVKINDVIIPSENYLLYPANELPKTRIQLMKNSFTKGEQNVEITGRWGYSVVCPLDISLAATILVVGIINFSGHTGDEIKSEKLADYSVTYKDATSWQDLDRAKQIIQNYIKISI